MEGILLSCEGQLITQVMNTCCNQLCCSNTRQDKDKESKALSGYGDSGQDF